MPACQCCGSEAKRVQPFLLEYQNELAINVCPNCFSECLANAKTLRAMVGRVAFILAIKGESIEGLSPEEVAERLGWQR